VQELVAANWPALTLLSSFEMPLDMGVLSLLSQAHWPHLAHLTLLNVSLPSTQERKVQETQHFSLLSNVLSSLVLKADPGRTSSSSSATSATLDWASLIVLTLTCQQIDTQMLPKLLHTGVNRVEKIAFLCVQLDAALMLQLTQSECPRLQFLILSHSVLGSAAMSCLAQGKWPMLKLLDLEGNVLEDEAPDKLITGDWPLLHTLRLTFRSLHDRAVKQWLGLSSDCVQEVLRHSEQDLQVRELVVKFSGSSADMQLPLQHIRHVYPCLATVTLCPPSTWPL